MKENESKYHIWNIQRLLDIKKAETPDDTEINEEVFYNISNALQSLVCDYRKMKINDQYDNSNNSIDDLIEELKKKYAQ